jgi:hypothetical protein
MTKIKFANGDFITIDDSVYPKSKGPAKFPIEEPEEEKLSTGAKVLICAFVILLPIAAWSVKRNYQNQQINSK